MIKIIYKILTTNDREQYKDNNNNDNVIKYIQPNNDNILLGQKALRKPC